MSRLNSVGIDTMKLWNCDTTCSTLQKGWIGMNVFQLLLYLERILQSFSSVISWTLHDDIIVPYDECPEGV
jgi:hypothetical protein